MLAAILIEPNSIFDDTALALAVGVSPTALAQARRSGRLRYTRKGRRVLYLGRWVLDWLGEAAEDQSQQPTT